MNCQGFFTLLALMLPFCYQNTRAFPGASFMATLSKARAQSSGALEVMDWQVQDRQEMQYQKGRGFIANAHGVYIIGYTVNAESPEEGSLKACININRGGKCQTLISEYMSKSTSKQGRNTSLHATGLVKLFQGDFISVRVESSSPWKLKLQTSIFGYMLQEYGMTHAFHVNPSSANVLSANERHLIRSWHVGKARGSFLSAPSFSANLGVYSVLKSGVYFIAVQLVIAKSRGRETYVITLVNGNVDLMKKTFGVTDDVKTVTLAMHTLAKLEMETRLYFHVERHGNTNSSILPRSSYSVGFLEALTMETRGFNLKSLTREKFEPDLRDVDLRTFTDANSGGFDTMRNGKYITQRTGMYLMCLNFEVFCPKASSCSITLDVNGNSLVLNSVGSSHRIQTSECKMLFLPKGTQLSLRAKSEKEWYLLEGSSISIALLREVFPALGLSLGTLSMLPRSDWIKVTKFSFNIQDFMLSDGFNGDEFTVSRSGIYKIFANLIFMNLNQASISGCVAVDGDYSSSDGLFATNSAVTGKHTLSISSAVYLRRKQRLGVFVKSIGRESWTLDTNSSISIFFLGERELVTGFQTSLLRHNTYTSVGWRTPSNWNKPTYMTANAWSFASKRGPSDFGIYKVPVDGLYYIAATIIIAKANLIDERSFFIGMISINEKTDAGLLHSKQARKTHATQVDVVSEFTLTLSSAFRLKANDSVSVKVCSMADVDWMIRKESGFAMILLSESSAESMPSGFFARYLNASESGFSRQGAWIWTVASTDKTLFQLGDGLKVSGDEILVIKAGMYAISMNIQLKVGIGRELEMAIIDVASRQKRICSKSAIIYKEAFAACNMLVTLFSGARLKIALTEPDQSSSVAPGPFSTLSMYRMERPKPYPWFFAELQENIEAFSKLDVSPKPLRNDQAGRIMGHSGLKRGAATGDVLLVTANYVFDSVGKGQCTIAVSNAHKNTTRVAMTLQYNSTWAGQATLSYARVIESSPDSVQQTIEAPGFFISKETSFSMVRLRDRPTGQRFSLSLDIDQTVHKTGRVWLQPWVITNSKGSELCIKDWTYIITGTFDAKFSTDYFAVSLETDKGEVLLRRILPRRTASFSSYTFSGIFIPKQSGTLRIYIQRSKSGSIDIKKQSRIQVASVGDNADQRVVLPLKETLVTYDGLQPMIQLKTGGPLHQNGTVVAEDTVCIRRTGIYLVSLGMMIASIKRLVYRVCIMVSEDKSASVCAMQEIFGQGTISLINSMYLQRGMFIKLLVTVNRRSIFTVMHGSTFGITQIKDLDFETDDKLLPIMYKDILPPGNHSFPLGHPFSLKCHSIADEDIIYNWFKNGNLEQSSESPSISLDSQSDETGEYYCETKASEVIMMSKPVKIGFYDNDECVEGTHTCTGNNQTCFNLPGAYKCVCDSGLFMNQGRCTGLEDKTGTKTTKMDKLNLPFAVVVLAPIAICVFIFLVVVALYTCYKTKKAATQRLIRHSGSFSEQRQLHWEDDTLSSLQNRSADATPCIEETLEMQELNFLSSSRELKNVRFSLQTDCDFDEYLEIQDEESFKDDGYLSPRTI